MATVERKPTRGFERREAGTEVYYKLANWDARNMMWRAGKVTFPTEAGAIASAKRGGRYRVSRRESSGWVELEPFEVGA